MPVWISKAAFITILDYCLSMLTTCNQYRKGYAIVLRINESPCRKLEAIRYETPPPLMGGDKGEGEQTFYHPHLPSPIKGEELYGNPAGSYRELSS